MKLQVTVDRFEGSKAILLYGEDGSSIDWPQDLLPAGLQEGDVLVISVKKDEKGTQEALAATEKLLRELLQDS